MHFDFLIFLSTFAVILPAELPDKSFLMTLVLATKQPRSAVWLGATIALGLQAAIAVAAGSLLKALPHTIVVTVVLAIFLIGAGVLFRMAWVERNKIGLESETTKQTSTRRVWGGAVLLTLGVVFTAEWGDITQIAAAANAAATGEPLSVGLGAWTAEIVVAGLGVWLGERIRTRIHPARLHTISGVVMLLLAAFSLTELLINN